MTPKSTKLPERVSSTALPAVATAPRKISDGNRPTKIEAVSALLHDLALGLGPGARMPRIHDMCARFDVSITTLTSALDHMEASGVLVRRRGSGIFVAAGVRRATVLLLCDAGVFGRPGLSPFWNLLIQSARARAATHALGFELHFAEAHYGPAEAEAPVISPTVAGLIEAGRVDGAIAVGIAAEATEYLESRGIPVVAFAGRCSHAVILDMLDLIQQGVMALAAVGARRIGLWSPFHTFNPREGVLHFQNQAREAFQQGLAAVGLPYEEALVRQNQELAPEPDSLVSKPYQEQGYETALAVFGGKGGVAPPDAILSTDDMLTVGALSALRQYGIRTAATAVEGEGVVCMATHANAGSPTLIGEEKNLILLEVDPNRVIETLFTMLEGLMEKSPSVPERIYIPGRVKTPGEM